MEIFFLLISPLSLHPPPSSSCTSTNPSDAVMFVTISKVTVALKDDDREGSIAYLVYSFASPNFKRHRAAIGKGVSKAGVSRVG